MNLAHTPRELVARLMDGYLSTQLLYVAARLGVADLLATGSRSIAELAAAAGAEPSALYRILRGLAIIGIVDEDSERRFALTEAGRYLQSDIEQSLRGAVLSRGELYYHAASGLLETARSGGAAFRHAYGVDFFDHLAASPDRLAAFQASMVARSRLEAEELIAVYDFSPFNHVVDVGGGSGVTIAAILGAYPGMHGTLFDLPEVVKAAQARLNAAGVTARCTVVGGDAFEAVPGGGDLYLLSRVIHDWDDNKASRILTSCRNAMADVSRLVLVETVISDRASDQPAGILMDLHMLTLVDGKERTAAEFSRVLTLAGFELRRIISPRGPLAISIIEADCM
jgi:hypothetical protein